MHFYYFCYFISTICTSLKSLKLPNRKTTLKMNSLKALESVQMEVETLDDPVDEGVQGWGECKECTLPPTP
jgi:hypothetical protein